jgi:hypothetical protein
MAVTRTQHGEYGVSLSDADGTSRRTRLPAMDSLGGRDAFPRVGARGVLRTAHGSVAAMPDLYLQD